jgi:hypothetical protein
MCGVMVWELISQNKAQGTPIAIKPNFNYMVGGEPFSTEVFLGMTADIRFLLGSV